MDLSTFLIHFGFEVGLFKQQGIEFADLNHGDESIWLTPGDEIDIDDITNFGFFKSKLVDVGQRLYKELPHEFKLFYLDITLIQGLRLEPSEPSPDLITKIMYRGMPCPINIETPTGDPHNLPLTEITLSPTDLVDAILGLQRLMPDMLAKSFPFGIPCKIIKKESNDSFDNLD